MSTSFKEIRSIENAALSRVVSWEYLNDCFTRGARISDVDGIAMWPGIPVCHNRVTNSFAFFEIKRSCIGLDPGQRQLYKGLLESLYTHAVLFVCVIETEAVSHEHIKVYDIRDVQSFQIIGYDKQAAGIAVTHLIEGRCLVKWAHEWWEHAQSPSHPNHFVTFFRKAAGVINPTRVDPDEADFGIVRTPP